MCTNKIIKSFLGTISGTISSLFITTILTDWNLEDKRLLFTVSCGGLSGGIAVFCFDNNDVLTITQNGIIGGAFGSLFVVNSINFYDTYNKKKRRHNYRIDQFDCSIKLNNQHQNLDLITKIENNLKSIENKNMIIENRYLQINNDFIEMKSQIDNLNLSLNNVNCHNVVTSNKILNGDVGILITNIGISEIKTVFSNIGKLFLYNLTINDHFKINSKEGNIIMKDCVFKLDQSLLKEYHLELTILNKSINRYYVGTAEMIYFDECNRSVVIKYKFDDSFIVPLCYPFAGILSLSISFYVL